MTNGERAENRPISQAATISAADETRQKRGRASSLRFRLVAVVVLIIAAIYTAIVAPFHSVILLNVNRETEALLREQTRLIESLLPDDRNLIRDELARIQLGVFSLQLTGTNGIPIVKSGPLAGELPLPARMEDLVRDRRGSVLEEVRTRSQQRVRVLTTWLDGPPGNSPLFLQLALSIEEKYARLRVTVAWFVAGGTMLLLASAFALFLILTPWQKQFRAVCNNAREVEIRAGQKERLHVPATDRDLADMADAFNTLLQRIEQSHGAQQRFIAEASHEMRTPLTIIQGEIDVILRREREAAEYREVMLSNKEEIEKLSRLVDGMLLLASADAREGTPLTHPIDLSSIAQSACKRLQTLASKAGVSLECKASAPAIVLGDRADLERAVSNLIENAIHYSPSGQSVSVTVRSHGREGVIEVSDHGEGIASEDVHQIFDRFFRVDKERSRQHGGVGLGLAIVKTVAEAHGGRVEVKSKKGSGSTFAIHLPLKS